MSDHEIPSTVQEHILRTLEGIVWGKTIQDISKETSYNRSVVSTHLKILKEQGVVQSRRVGKYSFWMMSTNYYERLAKEPRRLLHTIGLALSDLHGNKAGEVAFELGEKLGHLFPKGEFTRNQPIIFGKRIVIPLLNPAGRATVRLDYRNSQIVLKIMNCPCDGRKEAKPICDVIAGYLRGKFLSEFEQDSTVAEVRCRVNGHECCEYQIKVSDLDAIVAAIGPTLVRQFFEESSE